MVFVLTTCPRRSVAARIGLKALRARLVGCYDVYPRATSGYIWPPRSGRVAHDRGVLLVLTTEARTARKAAHLVRVHHTDTTPFVAILDLTWVDSPYRAWLKRELSNR